MLKDLSRKTLSVLTSALLVAGLSPFAAYAAQSDGHAQSSGFAAAITSAFDKTLATNADDSSATVFSENAIVEGEDAQYQDVYIERDATVTVEGTMVVDGDMYVFGALVNNGNVTVAGTLYCLNYNDMLTAGGDYDYGIVKSSGTLKTDKMVVKDTYLDAPIPTQSDDSSSDGQSDSVDPIAGDQASDGAVDPIADDPSSDQPGSSDSSSDNPASDDPATDKPSSDAPSTDEPASGDSSSDDPAPGDPVSDNPSSDNPVSGDPAGNEPTLGESTSDNPASGDSTGNDPSSDDPAAGDSGSDVPAPDTPAQNLAKVVQPVATDFVYDGTSKTGVPEGEGYVLLGAATAENAGSYTVVAMLKNGFVWSDETTDNLRLTWKIAPRSLEGAKVTVSPSASEYTGSAIQPEVTVSIDGTTLKPKTDYEMAYTDNVNPGKATVTVTGKGNYEGEAKAQFQINEPAKAAGKAVRLWGRTALDTMGKIVDEGDFAKGGTVMVATSEDFYDALTAASYAGLADAPVLLTEKNSLSPQTLSQISKLAPSRVVICGGTAAVSSYVEKQIAALVPNATVERAAGNDAIATANEVALAAARDTGKSFRNAAFIATPKGYWDALAAAPVAYAFGCPVFLARFDGTMDSSTIETMKELGITRAYICGGTAALPSHIETQLEKSGIRFSGRFNGRNAVDTSQRIARFGVANGMSADKMGIATRDGYWDALCGAALCGHNNSVLVLAADNDRKAIDGFVKDNAASISTAYVFGGEKAVSATTFDAVEAAIK